MQAEYTEITNILQENIQPLEHRLGMGTRAAGAVLYVAGVDFSELSLYECEAMNLRTASDIFFDTNYRRWRLVRKHVAQGLAEIKEDWQAVKQAKDSRLWGPIGSVVHYLTHLSYENEPDQTTAQEE